ncbi:Crp/Fnr family transcriptional regulator [Sphingobium sp.]|uniref:Crp/Fnr family transcriptional regulator n=1 Tax=Sphingobium sp. TaxID=1912891 RepID=UPI00261F7BC0|nr:Crp/Fnr family transcriptional regulator [Sphingobium sp.]
MQKEHHIEALEALLHCSRPSAALLLDILTVKSYEARHILARQGDVSRFCWLVVEGNITTHTLGIDGQRQQLARYGPGEFFGAYPDVTHHRAEVETSTATLLLRAEAEKLAHLVRANGELAAGMAQLLARQLDLALDRMAARTTYSAAGRVYNELMKLVADGGEINPTPQITTLALSANTTRETASRAINVLIRRGIVSRDGQSLIVHSSRMLRDLIV